MCLYHYLGWSECSVTYGGGVRSKSYKIIVPPSGNGMSCPSYPVHEACNEEACPTCTDGIHNGDEELVELVGSCFACPTCVDGMRNGDETQVDCAASCPVCRLKGFDLVGTGLCRESPCLDCNTDYRTESQCVNNINECRFRCKGSCQGIAYAPDPEADTNGCRS